MGKIGLSFLFLFIFIALNLVYANVDAGHGMGNTIPKNICLMKRFIVHIESDVNNLRFHCKSKDDDLGIVIRNAGEEYDINFCINFARSTLYFCHFYWESNQKVFNVFATKAKHNPDYCFGGPWDAKVNCYWLVKDDGFYVAKFDNPGPDDWVKRYDWE
ncbi:putative plant self-incompatibility S1 [Helianthus debilis subsp. tardiflorus]